MTEKEFATKIFNAGGRAYLVGGAVRDQLRGVIPHDKDYCVTKLDANDFEKIFPNADKFGKSFPVFSLSIDGRNCEVALARTERKVGRGYHGFKVNFDKVGEFVFPSLTDWTQNENPDIKYFSGTAVYTKDFTLRSKPRGRVFLKLEVKDIVSRIRINGQDAGYIWCAPYELDVTDFLKAGGNVLEITVANSLVNRMVGDCFLPEDQRHTYSLVPIVKTTTALKPSGISSAVEFYQY